MILVVDIPVEVLVLVTKTFDFATLLLPLTRKKTSEERIMPSFLSAKIFIFSHGSILTFRFVLVL